MASEEPSPSLPSVTTTSHPDHNQDQDQERSSISSSSSSVHEDGGLKRPRPKMTSRKSSGTIIVPREHPRVELQEGDEVFDEDDARAMSPRRSSQDLEKMSQDAKEHLNEYVYPIPLSNKTHISASKLQLRYGIVLTLQNRHAKVLQQSLLEIFNRIEAVKEEHDKLDNNNKFLQKYIGDLMSTSKITSTGASGRKK
jgi:short coiled-coil protein